VALGALALDTDTPSLASDALVDFGVNLQVLRLDCPLYVLTPQFQRMVGDITASLPRSETEGDREAGFLGVGHLLDVGHGILQRLSVSLL